MDNYRIIELHNNSLKVFRCGKVEVKRKHIGVYYEKKCTLNTNGHLQLPLNHNKVQKRYYMHRIVAYTFGILPTMDTNIMIDHIDRNPANNDVSNLRTATCQENNRNTNAKGYYYDKPTQKYRAQIKVDDKHIHLGRFELEADARQAYLDARIKYFGDFA